MSFFLSCATLYTATALNIPFYVTFGLQKHGFEAFSRHFRMPLWYSKSISSVSCTDQKMKILVSEVIILPVYAGYLSLFVVSFVLKYEKGCDLLSKKRPSGDGLIRKRNDGRWEGRIIVGQKQDGKFIYRSVFAKTQKELLPKLAELRLRYNGVELTEESAVTLGEWLDRWMSEYKQGVLRASTYARYCSDIKNHIAPHIGQKKLTQVRSSDIQKLYNALSGQGLASATVRGVHMILHSALACAVREGLLPKDPTEGASPPKIQRKEKRVLSKSEIGIFMKQLEGDAFWNDLFYTALLTGMRRGELCGIRWEDFDEQKGTLKVARSIEYVHGKLVIGETKTEDSKRVIFLPESLKRMLADKKQKSISEWIFPDLLDLTKPIRPSSAYYKLKSTLKAAGLPDIRFHDLRHTFASHAANSGIAPKTLAEIVGHSKASFTLDTYAHITTDMQRNASNIVTSYLTDILGKELKPWENAKVEQER